MRCPFCQTDDDKVVDSRTIRGGVTIRRRRECASCSRRFTTYERIEEVFPQIVKGDDSREDYDRQKVLRGLRLACVKRPISTEDIEAVVDRVEERLLALGQREVSSDWIGSAVTAELRDLDPVAYIRFASVYRAFGDIQEFLQELRGLEAEAAQTEDAPGQGGER